MVVKGIQRGLALCSRCRAELNALPCRFCETRPRYKVYNACRECMRGHQLLAQYWRERGMPLQWAERKRSQIMAAEEFWRTQGNRRTAP